jgi:hypothetical protein
MNESDKKVVVDFPAAKEITEDERNRRIMVEATRLANLAPGEWRLWIDGRAERLSIPQDKLEAAVTDIIKSKEKNAAEERRVEQRAEKKRPAPSVRSNVSASANSGRLRRTPSVRPKRSGKPSRPSSGCPANNTTVGL